MTSAQIRSVDAQADSYALALASGSGAGIDNIINSKSNIEVGSGATVTARNIVIEAKNELIKDSFGDEDNLKSGSASIGNVGILSSDTNIGTSANPFEARIDIGSGVHLTANGTNAVPGIFRIGASTGIRAVDRVKVESVSGFGVTVAKSNIDTYANATINVTGATLENQSGDLYLTTRSEADTTAGANLLIVTGVGGAGATASTNETANNTINIADSTLKGADIKVYAGRDNTGVPNILLGYANSQILAISLFGVYVPVVQSDITREQHDRHLGNVQTPGSDRRQPACG